MRHPAIHFNIAQCHRQLGDRARALFHYRMYLSEHQGKNPPYFVEVKEHIARLSASPTPAPASAPARARPPPLKPATRPAPPLAPAARQKRSTFWLVSGIVTASCAVGFLGLGISQDVVSSDHFAGDDEYERARTLGTVGYVLAGTFAAASVVSWIFYARSGRTPPKVTLVPGPGTLGAVVSF